MRGRRLRRAQEKERGTQSLRLVGIYSAGRARRLHRRDRHQGQLRDLRLRGGDARQALRRPCALRFDPAARLHRRGDDQERPARPDRPEQDHELRQSVARVSLHAARSGAEIHRALHDRHRRHRGKHREGESAGERLRGSFRGQERGAHRCARRRARTRDGRPLCAREKPQRLQRR